MATKKKVSKKTTSRRATKAPAVIKPFTPPKGYTTMPLGTGDFGTTHDFESEPVCEGKVVSIDTVEVGKGKDKKDTRVMRVETDNGAKSVWESKKLEPLFDDEPIGKHVYIQYLGIIPVKGRKQGMKDFAVALKGTASKKKSRG